MSKQLPRILFLSTRFPFPLDTGGKIRTANILRQLHKHFRVTVISNFEEAQDGKHLESMRETCSKFIPVPWTQPSKYTLSYYGRIFRRSLSRHPVTVLNDYSPAVESAMLAELDTTSYDLLICDFVQSAIHLDRVRDVPVLIFQHNVEAEIPRRHSETAANPLLRFFWKGQYRKMFDFEGARCRASDCIIAVSEVDRDRMVKDYGARNVHAIPTGVDTDFFAPMPDVPQKKSIVFVGSMDWEPNDDAMTFFLESVWPLVRRAHADTELFIVGRNPSPRLSGLAERTENVTLTGRVEDTRPYLAECAAFIVPIRIGGGTRIKIYEALAMEKAVVSTTVGAEGLPLEHDRHILFADEAGDFAAAVIELIEDEPKRARLARDGRSYVLENFRWEAVGQVFAEICHGAIGARETVGVE